MWARTVAATENGWQSCRVRWRVRFHPRHGPPASLAKSKLTFRARQALARRAELKSCRKMEQSVVKRMPPIPEVEQAKESALTWSQIEERAEAVASEYQFDREAETIRDFAERLGARVQVLPPEDVDRLESGSLVVRGARDFDILLSPSTSILRDNFTIAHELGHYFLHSGNPPGSRKIKATRYGKDRCEQQANRFAAALLMPAAKFREVAERINKNALAGWFRVSTQAVEARLSSLHIA